MIIGMPNFLFSGFLLLVFFSTSCGERSAVHPNILLIITDDQGYADLSATELNDDIQTPNIDRIADSGVRFMQGYSTSPICSASRAGLIAGIHQARWGNYYYGDGGLPDSLNTIPEYLKELGYHTVKIGKTHYSKDAHYLADTLKETHPNNHGFDEFFGFCHPRHDYFKMKNEYVEQLREGDKRFPDWGPIWSNKQRVEVEGYTTELFADAAIEQIENSEKPFYIQLSFNTLHEPFAQVPQSYLDKYGLQQLAEFDPNGDEKYNEFHLRRHWAPDSVPNGRLYYKAVMDALDDNIGRVLDALERTGKSNNTMVVLVADNGGSHNIFADNGPLSGHKYHLMEGGIRTPFIVSYPKRLPQNAVNDSSIVSSLDLLPTFVRAAGGKVIGVEGSDLLAVYDGSDASRRIHYWDSGWEWAVRSGDWKLRVVKRDYSFPNFAEKQAVYLFNLREGIGESINLAESKPKKVQELRILYNDWHSKNPEK